MAIHQRQIVLPIAAISPESEAGLQLPIQPCNSIPSPAPAVLPLMIPLLIKPDFFHGKIRLLQLWTAEIQLIPFKIKKMIPRPYAVPSCG